MSPFTFKSACFDQCVEVRAERAGLPDHVLQLMPLSIVSARKRERERERERERDRERERERDSEKETYHISKQIKKEYVFNLNIPLCRQLTLGLGTPGTLGVLWDNLALQGFSADTLALGTPGILWGNSRAGTPAIPWILWKRALQGFSENTPRFLRILWGWALQGHSQGEPWTIRLWGGHYRNLLGILCTPGTL